MVPLEQDRCRLAIAHDDGPASRAIACVQVPALDSIASAEGRSRESVIRTVDAAGRPMPASRRRPSRRSLSFRAICLSSRLIQTHP